MPTKTTAANTLAKLFFHVRSCCDPPHTIVTGKIPTAMQIWIKAMIPNNVTAIAVHAFWRTTIVFESVIFVVLMKLFIMLDVSMKRSKKCQHVHDDRWMLIIISFSNKLLCCSTYLLPSVWIWCMSRSGCRIFENSSDIIITHS